MPNEKFWNPNEKNNKIELSKEENMSSKSKKNNPSKNSKNSSWGHAALKVSGGVLAGVAAIAVLGYIFIGRPAIQVLGKVNALKNDASMVKQGFVNRDLVQVSDGLDSMENDLNELRDTRNKNLNWMRKIGFTRPYYEDSENFIVVGEHMVAAGREAVVLIEPFADAVGIRTSEVDEDVDESLMDAFSSWVAVMPEIAEDSDEIIMQLGLAGEALKEVDPNRYPKRVRGFEVRENIRRGQNVLTQLNEAAPDLKKALTLFPTLLGTDGEEIRYLIIMQNDKEIRATGGFWTNYATFKVKNAMLASDFSSRDMYNIDFILEAIDSYHDFPDAPPAYERYLKVERIYARDTNISPDFPTSLDYFMEFYNLAGDIDPSEIKPVSGVFAIDTVVVAELLDVTGPVTVNGVTYNSENVVLELEKIASLSLAEQAGRKKVLGDLMQAMLINLFESEKGLWAELIEKGIDLAIRKHILINLDSPEAQELIEKYDLGGIIEDPVEGDYAYVVSTNLGGDKTNWFVEKEVTHILAEENGRWKKTVTIDYTYPQPSAEYSPFITQFKDWVRVYVPEGSELISSEGIQDSFGGGSEKGKDYFDGFLTIDPGESKTVVFEYYLPEGVVVSGEPYNLLIQKQPGIEEEKHIIQVPGASQEIELFKDHTFTAEL